MATDPMTASYPPSAGVLGMSSPPTGLASPYQYQDWQAAPMQGGGSSPYHGAGQAASMYPQKDASAVVCGYLTLIILWMGV